MRIESNHLIIDKPLGDDALEEVSAVIKQPQIEVVTVKEDDIAASIVQLLWCISQDKKVEVESPFLKLFFEHIVLQGYDE